MAGFGFVFLSGTTRFGDGLERTETGPGPTKNTETEKKEDVAGLLLRTRRVAATDLWARGLGLVSIVDLQLLLWLFSCCEANDNRGENGWKWGGKHWAVLGGIR